MPITAVGLVTYRLDAKRRLRLCVPRADEHGGGAPRGWDACPRADGRHSRDLADAS